MRKALITLICLATIIPALTFTALAANNETYRTMTPEEIPQEQTDAAEKLYKLGLFQPVCINEDGTPNFALNYYTTRLQGIIIFIRFMGEEESARNNSFDTNFTDIENKKLPYISFALENNMIHGVSRTHYEPNNVINAAHFLTTALTILDYECGIDFGWCDSWNKTDHINLTANEFNDENNSISRGEMAIILLRMLTMNLKDSDSTLLDRYLENDIFENLAEQGIINSGKLLHAIETEDKEVIKDAIVAIINGTDCDYECCCCPICCDCGTVFFDKNRPSNTTPNTTDNESSGATEGSEATPSIPNRTTPGNGTGTNPNNNRPDNSNNPTDETEPEDNNDKDGCNGEDKCNCQNCGNDGDSGNNCNCKETDCTDCGCSNNNDCDSTDGCNNPNCPICNDKGDYNNNCDCSDCENGDICKCADNCECSDCKGKDADNNDCDNPDGCGNPECPNCGGGNDCDCSDCENGDICKCVDNCECSDCKGKDADNSDCDNPDGCGNPDCPNCNNDSDCDNPDGCGNPDCPNCGSGNDCDNPDGCGNPDCPNCNSGSDCDNPDGCGNPDCPNCNGGNDCDNPDGCGNTDCPICNDNGNENGDCENPNCPNCKDTGGCNCENGCGVPDCPYCKEIEADTWPKSLLDVTDEGVKTTATNISQWVKVYDVDELSELTNGNIVHTRAIKTDSCYMRLATRSVFTLDRVGVYKTLTGVVFNNSPYTARVRIYDYEKEMLLWERIIEPGTNRSINHLDISQVLKIEFSAEIIGAPLITIQYYYNAVYICDPLVYGEPSEDNGIDEPCDCGEDDCIECGNSGGSDCDNLDGCGNPDCPNCGGGNDCESPDGCGNPDCPICKDKGGGGCNDPNCTDPNCPTHGNNNEKCDFCHGYDRCGICNNCLICFGCRHCTDCEAKVFHDFEQYDPLLGFSWPIVPELIGNGSWEDIMEWLDNSDNYIKCYGNKCSVCSNWQGTRVTPIILNWHEVTYPTGRSVCYRAVRCSLCHDDVFIEAKEHDFIGNKCIDCGAVKCGGQIGANCTFGSWYIHDNDTHRRDCSVCDNYEADSHSYGEWSDWNSLGHTGHSKVRHCKYCGHTESESEEHDYGEWSEWQRDDKHFCSRTRTCKDCSYIQVETGQHDLSYVDCKMCSMCADCRAAWTHSFDCNGIDHYPYCFQSMCHPHYVQYYEFFCRREGCTESHVLSIQGGMLHNWEEHGDYKVCTLCGEQMPL